MFLYKKTKKLWSTAYYQENFQSPFKFEWVETASEDMQNPYQNMDERVQRVRILTYANIDFRKDDKVYIDNHGYLIEYVEPKDLPEYKNSPLFKTKNIGKELALVY